jgi:hypothetical protein
VIALAAGSGELVALVTPAPARTASVVAHVKGVAEAQRFVLTIAMRMRRAHRGCNAMHDTPLTPPRTILLALESDS